MINKKKGHTRRNFLKKIWTVMGILVGLEFLYLIYNFLRPQKRKDVASSFLFNAGTADEFITNSITPFRSRNFFLSRLDNGEFLALSTRCTHLGCILECDKNRNLLLCPCHASMFDIEGNVLRSPATRKLDRLEVTIENNQVLVHLNKADNQNKKS